MPVLRWFGLIGWALRAVLAAVPATAADDEPKIEFSPDLLVAQAREHLANGRNTEAIADLKETLEKRRVDARARLMASEAYLRISYGAAAERELKRADRNLGSILIDLKDHRGALAG